jgi:hypothetical protein
LPPGVEITDQTMVASRYVSTLLNFAPRPIGSPARGAGSFAAVGLNNTYSLLPITSSLRPQPLVGNGFIRSVCTDLACTKTIAVGAIIDRPFFI